MAVLPTPPANRVSLCSTNINCRIVGTFVAVSAMPAGQACQIFSSGSVTMVRQSNAIVLAFARVDGFTANACNAGDLVTIYNEVIFNYPTTPALVVGSRVYLGLTVGQYDDTSVGGFPAIGVVLPDTSVTLSSNPTTTRVFFKAPIN